MSPDISFIQGDDTAIAIAVTQSGLASRTTGVETVVGTNTNWTSALVGCDITFADGFSTTVASVTDATHLTLGKNATTTDTLPATYTATVNITNWLIFFTVKTNFTTTPDSTALIQVNVSNHTNPTQGLSSIPLAHSVTNVTAGTFFYDIRMNDANGNLMSVRYGQCIIYPAITQRVS